MTKSEVQEILDDADVNNDGKLDYNEVNVQSLVGQLYVLEEHHQVLIPAPVGAWGRTGR